MGGEVDRLKILQLSVAMVRQVNSIRRWEERGNFNKLNEAWNKKKGNNKAHGHKGQCLGHVQDSF